MSKADLNRVYNTKLRGFLAFAALVFVVPWLMPSNYFVSTLVLVGIFSLSCIGLNMLIGFTGQISLGHAAFYGIGAYTSAVVSTTLGMSPWLGIVAGALLSAVVATLIGIPTLKLKEHYLALASLGFGIIVWILFKELKGITGGLNGFYGIPGIEMFGFPLNTDVRFYYLVWTAVMLGILFGRNIIQSRVGRALRSIHGSEVAADALGIPIHQYKIQVFVLSAVYSSVAGSLYAHYVSFISPQLFDAMTSIYFLLIVIVGGTTRIWGPVAGSFAYVFILEALKGIVPLVYSRASGEFEIIFFGLLLVAMLIYLPDGLAPLLDQAGKRLLRLAGQGGRK